MLILASGSPRRRELLRLAGLTLRVEPSLQAERSARVGENPVTYASELALSKARDVAGRFRQDTVLAADTVVTIDGAILGKPGNRSDGGRMLRLLRGRAHSVITAVAVCRDDRTEAAHVAATVVMRSYGDDDIERYLATGEPMDKAGAYAVQGIGGDLVDRVDGCYNTVVGLPICLAWELLAAVGEPLPNGIMPACDHTRARQPACDLD
jgi:septum formation protein